MHTIPLKKLALLGIVTGAHAEISHTAYSIPPIPQPIVFAFDIHGVLVELNAKQLIKNIFVEWYKSPFLPFYVFNDFLHGTLSRQPGARNIANSQIPVASTWVLVRQLHDLGYPLFIFSNIEAPTYQDLSQRYKNYFSLFDGAHVVQPTFNDLRKPHQLAYESFRLFLRNYGLADPLIILIDDSPSNVIAAQHEPGFQAILFTTPEELAAKLQPFISCATYSVLPKLAPHMQDHP
jgi:FMN phosphatase YigB (HAD superfamily)